MTDTRMYAFVIHFEIYFKFVNDGEKDTSRFMNFSKTMQLPY